jgi:subfamily B ATP-binding cassette protein HlyB/CyaB
LDALIEGAGVEHFGLGDTIVRAGEDATAFYILLSGRARLLAEADNQEHLVATLKSPAHFGETAFLEGKPYSFSLRAASNITLLRVEGTKFSKILSSNPELKGYFQKYVSEVSIRAFLKLCTFLTSVSAKQIKTLLHQFEEVDLKDSEYAFKSGDEGDALYIVRSGRVEVLHPDDGTRLRVLEEGAFFGELALVYGTSRTASVRALGKVELFRLSKKHFDRLVEKKKDLKDKFLQAVSFYHLEDSLREEWGLKGHHAKKPPPRKEPEPQPLSAEEKVKEKVDIRPKRGRFPLVKQLDSSDCGAACLAMILRYWGTRVGLSRLRDMANVTRYGASLLSLAKAAEKLGLSARGVRLAPSDLDTVGLPMIAHWKANHWVVVYKVRGKKVYVADPDRGLVTYRREEFLKHWTGGVALLVEPTSALAQTEQQKSSWKRFIPLVASFKTLLLEVFVASLVMDILGLASPIFTQNIIDQVLVRQSLGMLNIMAVGMVIVMIFQTLTSSLRRYLLAFVSRQLDLRLLIMFYRHLLGLPTEYFEKRRVGDFISRFRETAKIRALLTGTVVTTLLDTLMVGVYLALMFYYNVKLTVAMLVFVPIFAFITFAFTPVLKSFNRQIFEEHTTAQSLLIESIGGIHTVKAMNIEQGIRWRWEELYTRAVNTSFRFSIIRIFIDAGSSLLNAASAIFLLYVGARMVINGELTVGQLMAFNALMGSVLAPISRLIGLWDDIQETLVSVERLNDVLDSELEQRQPESAIRLNTVSGHIHFEDVNFAYGEDQANVLNKINLEIHPGQTVALVGRSGSGKSTLIKLLLGFYRPTSGRILVDGTDLAALDLGAYRQCVGSVLQENFLFSGSVKENIALGDPNPKFDKILSAARLANAHDFIQDLPHTYETEVGERGNNLSGGQRQRVCIARTLYQDPSLIVLDEATSNLDLETEKVIQENLDRVLDSRTALIIAHRFSTVRKADMIVVIDAGEIVETGTHKQLMEKRGLYYYLNGQQLDL